MPAKPLLKRPAGAAEMAARKRPAASEAPRPGPCGHQALCVVGEALIDFLPRTTKDGESCYLPKAGGSPFNVCIAARRLGLPVHFFGGLSTDLFGEELFAHLAREGVGLELVQRVSRPSTLAFVGKAAAGADVKYAFFKENSADRCLTRDHAAQVSQAHTFGAVHLSLGAVTLEDAQMAEAFSTLFRQSRSMGAFTCFDPNIRANMIETGHEAYCKTLEGFIALADIVKASDADIEFLCGKQAKLEDVAERWLDCGPRLVVVTRGPDGAIAFYRPADSTLASCSAAPPTRPPCTIDASGRAVPVADTVGAGDTCTGGLLYGLLGGGGAASLAPQLAGGAAWDAAAVLRLQDVLAAAVAAAAINVSRPGCDPPSAKELATALATTASTGSCD